MTDQHEPEPGLPTAGRKPPPVDPPQSGTVDDDGDEATTRLPSMPALSPGEATTRLSPPVPEEPTTRLQPLPESTVGSGVGEGTRVIASPDDEPTVERPRQPAPMDLDGPTRPLWGPQKPTVELEPQQAAPERAEPQQAAPERAEPQQAAPERAEPQQAAPEKAQTPKDEPKPDEPEPEEPQPSPEAVTPLTAVPRWKSLSSAGALICVLLALFGFTLVVQLRSNDGDQGLATARQEDLVRILSDLEARDSRLQSEISALENSQRQLTSGVAGRQAAQAEAEKRADELGLLAGTLPGRGPGLRIVLDRVKASAMLNAVQELRGSGGEVMQLTAGGGTVRLVASSYFVDAEGGGIVVDGVRLTGPYTLDVIGPPQTMQPALQIPGGVVASVNSGGGSVTLEQRSLVEVTAVRKATNLQYARPVS